LGWDSPLIDKKPTAAEYITLYEQGLYTRSEIVSLFVTWAAEHSPENLIHGIPVEFISGIRDLVTEPPKSIADVFAPKSGPVYVDAWFRGCWSWNHFFFHTNGGPK